MSVGTVLFKDVKNDRKNILSVLQKLKLKAFEAIFAKINCQYIPVITLSQCVTLVISLHFTPSSQSVSVIRSLSLIYSIVYCSRLLRGILKYILHNHLKDGSLGLVVQRVQSLSYLYHHKYIESVAP